MTKKKWIANKDLPYSTGNSAPWDYNILDGRGVWGGRDDVYTCS